jgi:heterodisulfide reductase subunit A-like polyferredoxin
MVHTDDSVNATRKAIDIVSSGVARTRGSLPVPSEERPVEGSVLVLGAGICGLTAARSLVAQGYSVTIVSGPKLDGVEEQQNPEQIQKEASLIEQLEEQGVTIMPWPQGLDLSGSPGSYEVALKYSSQDSLIMAGAVILNLGELGGEVPPEVSTIPRESLLGRILARKRDYRAVAGKDFTAHREFTIKDTSGIFIILPDGEEPPEEQILRGAAAAAQASAYLCQGIVSPRATAVTIESKLCRGCGDCATICSFIEIRDRYNGTACAYVDKSLCLGCGACIAHCPTGAITQSLQSDEQIIHTLEALLGKVTDTVEAR